MAKEIKGSSGEDISGGGSLEDGLDQASEQTAKLNDISLANLFLESNDKAKERDSTPITELFHEEKKTHEFEIHEPDPQRLKEIYESLSKKEIHHKKLLEEGAPTNIFLKLINYLKGLFSFQTVSKEQVSITPTNWKKFAAFWKAWRTESFGYANNFASLTDLYLRKPNFSKKMVRWEMLVMLLIIAISCPIMILFSKDIFTINANASVFATRWSEFIFSSAIISCVLAVTPIFFFVSLWFVNINHLHNSKYFHLCLFTLFTLSIIFLCLSVFNAALFHLIDSKLAITTPGAAPVPKAQ